MTAAVRALKRRRSSFFLIEESSASVLDLITVPYRKKKVANINRYRVGLPRRSLAICLQCVCCCLFLLMLFVVSVGDRGGCLPFGCGCVCCFMPGCVALFYQVLAVARSS